jgi:hypothetical protein
MKQLLFILVGGMTIISFSCKKESTNLDSNAQAYTTTGTSGGQSSGSNVRTTSYIWSVNSLVVNGSDLTSQLSGYRFDIQAPRLMTGAYTIVAVGSSGTYYGKWDRVSYGEVIITFSSNNDALSLLNGDWTLTNNQEYDISMQTGSKSLSFHTNGETWPDK